MIIISNYSPLVTIIIFCIVDELKFLNKDFRFARRSYIKRITKKVCIFRKITLKYYL